MANSCYNVIKFQSVNLSPLKMQELIKVMASREEKDEQGHSPALSIAKQGYFLHICWCEYDIVTYQIKYMPSIEVLIEIAKAYGCDFECEYEELGSQIYGKATYIEGVLNNIYLETEDFEKFSFDQLNERYLFEGKAYRRQLDIVEILLHRKIDNNIKNPLQ